LIVFKNNFVDYVGVHFVPNEVTLIDDDEHVRT
jgi:hypothetical protein